MNLVEFMYRALDSKLGIVITTNNPERLRQRFYQARREAMNPDFEALVFAPSRVNQAGELYIVRKLPDGEKS